MAFVNGYQILIYSCLVILAKAQMPILDLPPGLYNVNEPLTGKCTPTSQDKGVELLYTGASRGCLSSDKPDDSEKLANIANVTEMADTKTTKFNLTDPKLKVYNIWCHTDRTFACEAAVMYNMSVSEIEGGVVCSISIADGGRAPNNLPLAVQWLRNGNLVVEQTLSPENFTDAEGADAEEGLKAFSYSLTGGSSQFPAVYECRFTQANPNLNKLTATFVKYGPPVENSFTFDPFQEQYKDTEEIVMTCAFSGYPAPNITWYHNDQPLEDFATELNDTITNSVFSISSLEDSKHKGDYKCVAKNSKGDATSVKRLHVRDNLAPLWPFLGIVVQVVLLAICITLGEKYRKKTLAKKRTLLEMDGKATDT